MRADDVAKVCVHYSARCAPLKPPRHQRHHRVRLPAVASKAAHEVRAFFGFGAIAGDESGNGLIVECRDEHLNVLRVCGDVTFCEIEKCCVKRLRNLRRRQHFCDVVDGAKAEFEIGIFSR